MKSSIILPALGIALGITFLSPFSAVAQSQDMGTLTYYNLTSEEYHSNYAAWRNFMEYHGSRERCQGYRAPPTGFYMKDCNVYRVQPEQMAEVQPVVRTETTTVTERHLLPIVSTYTIYFDFDKSNLRTSEMQTLERVAREINTYHPQQITVAGYTDTSGAPAYNEELSQKRAMTVAKMLTSYDIKNEVIDKRAYGEADLAVETGDNVKLEKNRRVVIDFRREQ